MRDAEVGSGQGGDRRKVQRPPRPGMLGTAGLHRFPQLKHDNARVRPKKKKKKKKMSFKYVAAERGRRGGDLRDRYTGGERLLKTES